MHYLCNGRTICLCAAHDMEKLLFRKRASNKRTEFHKWSIFGLINAWMEHIMERLNVGN